VTEEMHVVAARVVAMAHEKWATAEQAYERGDSAFAYWMMIDLRRSAYYRELAGSEFAYCRAETFSAVFANLVSYYESVDIVKELGDGLLIRSVGWKPLIELVSLADAVRRSWPAGDQRKSAPNFDFSCALTAGECVRLPRQAVLDYLGSPIDRVARISGFRDPLTPNLLAVIESSVATEIKLEVQRDYPFLQIDTPRLLPDDLQKAGEDPLRISRMLIDRSGFDGFRRFFSKIRNSYM
jgi:hypothetical protein